jgi:hypothetical protein
MDGIEVVYISIGAWFTLGAFMYWVFVRMQLMERDTRLPEELGNMPLGQHFGTGSVNGARPVRKPFARLTFYKDFVVASFKSQRISMPYSTIESLSKIDARGRTWIEVTGIANDKEQDFVFSAPDISEVIAELEKYTGLPHG